MFLSFSQSIELVFSGDRPEVMDPAVLRPGRFGKLLYVPLPSPDDRGLILKALAKGKPIDPSVDLSAIGQMNSCENLSGADLKKLVCLCFQYLLITNPSKTLVGHTLFHWLFYIYADLPLSLSLETSDMQL